MVAIPFKGLGQLGVAEPRALEAIANGAAEGFVGVAAEAELGVAVHWRKLGCDDEKSQSARGALSAFAAHLRPRKPEGGTPDNIAYRTSSPCPITPYRQAGEGVPQLCG
jgi:hypothetical protein